MQALKEYYNGFYISRPVGNNEFSFKERTNKRIFVPPIIEGGMDDLAVGDKVEIEVVETIEIDQPKKRFRSDHEVQEDPFTEEEAREMRYQDYLELKKEFENEIT